MDNFRKEFVFVIIERINLQISAFHHICHQQREFDVILMCDTGLHPIVFFAFRNLKSSNRKTHHSQTVH